MVLGSRFPVSPLVFQRLDISCFQVAIWLKDCYGEVNPKPNPTSLNFAFLQVLSSLTIPLGQGPRGTGWSGVYWTSLTNPVRWTWMPLWTQTNWGISGRCVSPQRGRVVCLSVCLTGWSDVYWTSLTNPVRWNWMPLWTQTNWGISGRCVSPQRGRLSVCPFVCPSVTLAGAMCTGLPWQTQ